MVWKIRHKPEILMEIARSTIELGTSILIPYTDEGEALKSFYQVVKWYIRNGVKPVYTELHAQCYQIGFGGHGRICFDGPGVYRVIPRKSRTIVLPHRKEK